MIEEWRFIKGYGKSYEVSNLGRVRSWKKHRGRGIRDKPRILSQSVFKYPKVSLLKNGVQKTTIVHRLVAEHFIDNPENKPCINHIDGNKTNNNVDNLEWCTYSENAKHAHRTGLNKMPIINGDKNPNSKLNKNDIIRIRSLSNSLTGIELAEMFKTTKSNISSILNHKTWTHV